MQAIYKKVLTIPGFNASVMPFGNQYIGVVRVCEHHDIRGVYPEGTNLLYRVVLDDTFRLIECVRYNDTSGRMVHKSWTAGIEDSRVLTQSSLVAVTCDSSPHWKPEISLISIDASKNEITRVLPLRIPGVAPSPQKNWLFLRAHTDELHDYLYSSFPFKTVRVNVTTGECSLLSEANADGYALVAHNGSVLPIEDGGFLLTVRVKSGYSYHYSVWVKLNRDYNPVGVSRPFRFVDNRASGDNEFRPGGYEMCMSLWTEEEGCVLVACVSENDEKNTIFKYRMADIDRMFMQ